jgi:uncharacterized protein YbbC (DUF1343 family)
LRKISGFQGGFRLEYFLDFYRLSGEKAAFFTRPSWFDLLAGNKLLRKQMTQGMDEKSIRKTWEKDLADYRKKRIRYLLY